MFPFNTLCPLKTPEISEKTLFSGGIEREHVVIIARGRVQYGKYFPIIAKYEKRGKCLPILYEATCDNYFFVKCLLKSNIARVIFFIY